jgi:8-oxo-dGTP diphosphatase
MIRVVTRAIVRAGDGGFWLMRRSENCRDEHGRWDTCAGMLEEGWRAEDNMRRELAEELGVTPVSLSSIGWQEAFRPGNAAAPHCVVLDYLAVVRKAGVTIAEPRKFTDGGWFTLAALPHPQHSCLPGWLGAYRDYFLQGEEDEE